MVLRDASASKNIDSIRALQSCLQSQSMFDLPSLDFDNLRDGMMTWVLPGPAQDLQSVLLHDPGSFFCHRSE